MDEIEAWPGLRLDRQISEGNRNEVWAATLGAQRVAVRRSGRCSASLAWELDLLEELAGRGFRVPLPITTRDGASSHDGIVVQHWVDGSAPSSNNDWKMVASELQRLHSVCGDIAQRPGCLTVQQLTPTSRSVDADMEALPHDIAETLLGVFATFADAPVSLIHGDPGPSNIRITADNKVTLLDWDESRVDVTWQDLSNLGIVVLDPSLHHRATRLSDAWEAANAWTTEPDYARMRFRRLAK